jgi:hypothetical protein
MTATINEKRDLFGRLKTYRDSSESVPDENTGIGVSILVHYCCVVDHCRRNTGLQRAGYGAAQIDVDRPCRFAVHAGCP